MSQNINDNFSLNAGKPLDNKYYNPYNKSYINCAEVNSTIPIPERYSGLTVNIGSIEYWYKNGVQNTDLVEKTTGSVLPISNYVTGATNLGFFSGYTGRQTLPISHLTNTVYNGDYKSMYNYYYRGTDGKIHVGTPSDGIPKRGYIKETTPVKSLVWSEYTGDNELLGWTLIDGDISTQIGSFQYAALPLYYNGTTRLPYTNTEFISGAPLNNNSWLVFGTITGDMSTGTTVNLGGRVYQNKTDNKLNLRTVISVTPNTINVADDESFIRISGATVNFNVQNTVGDGVAVYKERIGDTFYFKRILGSGSTTVISCDNNLIIRGSGGIDTTYTGYSPTSVSVGGITANTDISTKTTFQIIENLLSPILYPTITVPSTQVDIEIEGQGHNYTYEVGYRLEQARVVSELNRGCINPQYNATSNKRSGCAHIYVYDGPIITCSICNTYDPSDIRDISGYKIIEGVQSIDAYICYQSGVQPYNNRGNTYLTPLPYGVTPKSTVSLCGILPWYWGTSESCVVDGNCVISYGYHGLGGKCVGEVNDNVLTIDYNMDTEHPPKYIWFAVPNCSDLMTKWKINDGNKGCIGNGGDLFKAPYTCTISSEMGYWNNCNYEIYVSCYPTIINNETICIE